MAKSMMVNFRAPADSVDMYDEAAETAGMSRSQWLRNAAELALSMHRDKGFTPKANTVPVQEGPKCVEGDWRKCSMADWRKLPTGLRQCASCGVRTS